MARRRHKRKNVSCLSLWGEDRAAAKRNLQDLDELPDNVRKQMQFIPVEHLDDVLQVALEEANE